MTYNIKDMNACFIYNLVENKKGHTRSAKVYISYYSLYQSLSHGLYHVS